MFGRRFFRGSLRRIAVLLAVVVPIPLALTVFRLPTVAEQTPLPSLTKLWSAPPAVKAMVLGASTDEVVALWWKEYAETHETPQDRIEESVEAKEAVFAETNRWPSGVRFPDEEEMALQLKERIPGLAALEPPAAAKSRGMDLAKAKPDKPVKPDKREKISERVFQLSERTDWHSPKVPKPPKPPKPPKHPRRTDDSTPAIAGKSKGDPPNPFENLDLTEAYDALVVLGLPEDADLNGASLDDAGELIQGPNGIPDLAEFLLLEAILKDQSNSAYAAVAERWFVVDGAFVVPEGGEPIDPALKEALVAYGTLQDPLSCFLGFLISMVCGLELADMEQFTEMSAIAPAALLGDADDDGYQNFVEWQNANGNVQAYLAAAMDDTAFPQGPYHTLTASANVIGFDTLKRPATRFLFPYEGTYQCLPTYDLSLGIGYSVPLSLDRWELNGAPSTATPAEFSVTENSPFTVYLAPNMDRPVDFPDPNLDRVVRSALNLPTGQLYWRDTLNLTTLNASGQGIENLDGLDFCNSLTELELRDNSIEDIGVLDILPNMTRLDLSGNEISDIFALSGMFELVQLYLYDNLVSDLAPLAHLEQLATLDLGLNQITDVTALSQLVELQSLQLGSGNRLSHDGPLPANTNQITDISSLSGLTDLRVLDVSGNPIADLSVVGGLSHLQLLWLMDLPATNFAPLQTLASAQQSLLPAERLMLLGVSKTGFGNDDMQHISGFTNLLGFVAEDTAITDLSSLPSKANMLILLANDNAITSIAPLSVCGGLGILGLQNCDISNVSALTGMASLEVADLLNNDVSSLAAIASGNTYPAEAQLGFYGNPLTPATICDDIPVIEARGNTVHHDGFCSPVTLTTLVVGTGEIEPPANSPRQFEQNEWIDVQAFETDPEWRFESWLTTPPLGIEYLSNTAPIPTSPYLSFPIEVSTTVTANFTRPAHELTIAVQGTGSTTPPPGVYRFFPGEVASVEAFMSLPDHFGWWEDAAGQTIGTDSHLDITMDADKTAKAVIRHADVVLTVNVMGLGTVNPPRGSHPFYYGDVLQPVPTPASGWMFDHWEGDVTGPYRVPYLVMSPGGRSNLTITAVFVEIPDTEVLFPDANLEAAVRSAINKPTGDIRRTDLVGTGFTSLSAPDSGIQDLTGLEYCRDLTNLNLSGNAFSDIGPLAFLYELRYVYLRNNAIQDLSSFTPLHEVRHLDLAGNPLGSGSGLAPLASLVRLETLILSGCALESDDLNHIKGLPVRYLTLDDNAIVDLTHLSAMSALAYLYIGNNAIVEITPLLDNPNLGQGDTVNLAGNTQLSQQARCVHVPALRDQGVNVTAPECTMPLTVTIVGQGTVSHESGEHPVNETITLQATPAAGHMFHQWSGDLSGYSTSQSITMSEPRSVTAEFRAMHTLACTIEGSGAVAIGRPEGSTEPPIQGGYNHIWRVGKDTTVRVQATPSPGGRFIEWYGDVTGPMVGSINPNTFVMTTNLSFTARFAALANLTVNTRGIGTVAVAGKQGPSPYVFEVGQTATLTAYPAPGWQFDHWEGAASGSASPRDVVMTYPKTVTAVFIQRNLTLSPSSHGSISATCSRGGTVIGQFTTPGTYHVLDGDVITLTATPDTDWQFDQWQGSLSGSTNPATLVIQGTDATVGAVFIQPNLIISECSHGSIAATCSRAGTVIGQFTTPGTYHVLEGDVISLTATSAPDWQFDQWEGAVSGNANPATLVIQAADATVGAVFIQRNLTISESSYGSIAATCSRGGTVIGQFTTPGTYHVLDGDVISLTATPATDWQFDHWEGSFTRRANPTTLTIDGNETATAVFIQRAFTLDVAGEGTIVATRYRTNAPTVQFAAPGTYPVLDGDVIELSATPSAGWEFDEWLGVTLDASNRFTVDGDVAATAQFGQAVSIPDANLEAALREALAKPTGNLYVHELESLTQLEAPLRGIVNLTGLEYCANLTDANLFGNQIADLSPLAGLTLMQVLALGASPISDLTPLQGLASLQHLSLWSANISSLAPLAGLTEIISLIIHDNTIPLSQTDALTPLAGLTNLETLSLMNCGITNIAPLAGLAALAHVTLSHNAIVDIFPLGSLASLHTLYLDDNQITQITGWTGLTALHTLSMTHNLLTTTAGLTNLSTLEILRLDHNRLSDISSLGSLASLKTVYLNHNLITQVSGWTGLIDLRELYMEYNRLSSTTGLTALAGLRTVRLNDNHLADVTGFAALPLLRCLYLQANYITDISPLFSNLTIGTGDYIDLHDNPLDFQSACNIIPIMRLNGAYVYYPAACANQYTDGDSFSDQDELDYLRFFYLDPDDLNVADTTSAAYEWIHDALKTPPASLQGTDFHCIPTSTLTIEIEGQGEVSPGPGEFSVAKYAIGCTTPCSDATVHPCEGSPHSIPLTAVPAEGWFFKEWRGLYGSEGAGEPQTLVETDSDRHITAVFVDRPGIEQLDLVADLECFLDALYGSNGQTPPDVDTFDHNGVAYDADAERVFIGNGIPDAAELYLLEQVLRRADLNLTQIGGVFHTPVWNAWTANLAAAGAALGATTLPCIVRVAAAYMTLGSFDSVAAIADLLGAFPTPYCLGDSSEFDRTRRRFLAPEADADADGITNMDEWQYAVQIGGLADLTGFADLALGMETAPASPPPSKSNSPTEPEVPEGPCTPLRGHLMCVELMSSANVTPSVTIGGETHSLDRLRGFVVSAGAHADFRVPEMPPYTLVSWEGGATPAPRDCGRTYSTNLFPYKHSSVPAFYVGWRGSSQYMTITVPHREDDPHWHIKIEHDGGTVDPPVKYTDDFRRWKTHAFPGTPFRVTARYIGPSSPSGRKFMAWSHYGHHNYSPCVEAVSYISLSTPPGGDSQQPEPILRTYNCPSYEGGYVKAMYAFTGRVVYDTREPLHLEAVPRPGWVFDHWIGAAKAAEEPSLKLGAYESPPTGAVFRERNVGKFDDFPIDAHVLLANPGRTSSEPGDGAAGYIQFDTSNYSSTREILLEAKANPGYGFLAWDGDHAFDGSAKTGSGSTLTVEASPDTSVNALFTPAHIQAVEFDRFKPDSPEALNGRIFPGKIAADDQHGPDRQKVVVRAVFDVPVTGKEVFFRVFDVDDPSDTTLPVDLTPDGAEPVGNDNRGQHTLSPIKAITSVVGGEASAETVLTVSLRPGDNYRVAASDCEALLEDADIERKVELNEEIPGVCVSDMLTVWRKLHIEQRSMDAPDASEPFGTLQGTVASVTAASLSSATPLCSPDLLEGSVLDPDGNSAAPALAWGSDRTWKIVGNTASAISVQTVFGGDHVDNDGDGAVDEPDENGGLPTGIAEGTPFSIETDDVAWPILPAFDPSDPTHVFQPADLNTYFDDAFIECVPIPGATAPFPFKRHTGTNPAECPSPSTGQEGDGLYWTVCIGWAYELIAQQNYNESLPGGDSGPPFYSGDDDPEDEGVPASAGGGAFVPPNSMSVPGMAGQESCMIFLEAYRDGVGKTTQRPFSSVVAHEIGHVLGLQHSDYGPSRSFPEECKGLMGWDVPTNDEFNTVQEWLIRMKAETPQAYPDDRFSKNNLASLRSVEVEQ